MRDPKKGNDRFPKDKFRGENFFDHSGTTIKGKKVRSLKQLGGKKATLVVNVASGEKRLTHWNYKGLVELTKEYEKQGLKVIAYPSNDFGGCEPGTAKEI